MPVRHGSKTFSLHQLKKLFRISLEANSKQTNDVTALAEENKFYSASRRKFLKDTSKIALLAGVTSLYKSCAPANTATQPTIAIVGAGIAGLYAAYILKQAGYEAYVYEGSGRIGGRINSVSDMLGPGLWTEMGGEFIDSTHTEMLNLCTHFNLPLLDRMDETEKNLEEFAYYFNGQHYHEKDVIAALKPYAARIKADVDSLSEEISYKKFSPTDKKFDSMSIMEYLDSIGISGWLRSMIYNSYTAEYGMEATEQSAISFLSVFDVGDENHYNIYGSSNERYSIIGGNIRLCEALAAEMTDYVLPNHFLTAIKQSNDKSYRLNFKMTGGGIITANADIVILTLPFTVLREVEINVPLPAWKMNTIKNLGYGTNSKLFFGMNERIWRKQGYGGYAFADNGMMNGYDNTMMQNNNIGPGGYTIFPGGKAGVDVGSTDPIVLKEKYITSLDGVYPGAKAQFNNNFQFWCWPTYGYSKGSYVSFKVNQYTTMAGTEFEPIDNLYFAGEHCSYAFQGFMNGGAETGRVAAEMIIKKLKGK
jgi:monoamine oxidase